MQVNLIGPQIKDVFEKSKNAVVVLSDSADIDEASLAATMVELFSSYNKKATLLSRRTLPEAASPLVKTENIKGYIDPKSLVISLNWKQNKLEKLSYKIENDRFNLIISSKGAKLNPSDVKYSYKGDDFDLVICVGINSLEILYSFGFDDDYINRVPSINFDKNSGNTNFAKLNITTESADSVCSLAANAFREAGLALPTKTAEIMLYGMRIVTSNFANVSDPSTFEGAAYCKRSMIPGMLKQTESSNIEKKEVSDDKEIPENWVTPKIYRSSRLS